jgi:hypothetical protein
MRRPNCGRCACRGFFDHIKSTDNQRTTDVAMDGGTVSRRTTNNQGKALRGTVALIESEGATILDLAKTAPNHFVYGNSRVSFLAAPKVVRSTTINDGAERKTSGAALGSGSMLVYVPDQDTNQLS